MAKAYEKTDWKDHIVDSTTGKILQQGTPVSASKLNHIEEGIDLAHQKMEGANRQTVNISHGVQVINGDVDAPVSLQMEGRTLIPLQNTELDAAKYYVLADKKTKLKFSDSFSVQGVAKFPGVNAKVQAITRTANFENKVSGSTLENPHKVFQGQSTAILSPVSDSWGEQPQVGYNAISKLDGSTLFNGTNVAGRYRQQLFSFNIIEEIERNLGKIPRNTLAEKIQWCKDNLSALTANWHGYGSGPTGNKATIQRWRADTSAWIGSVNNTTTANTITKVVSAESNPSILIDANGFIHFVAYSEPSDGIIDSTIYTDYIELLTELKPGITLHAPRIPLYEVTKEHYDNILVTWNEDEVIRRYPAVEGVQHVQNPYIIAEGENLIPPLTEATNNGDVTFNNPYSIIINTTVAYKGLSFRLKVVPGQQMTLSSKRTSSTGNTTSNPIQIFQVVNGSSTFFTQLTADATTLTFTPTANELEIKLTNTRDGIFTFDDVMLNYGATAKPFVPRNPSYLFAEVKLGALGIYKDFLYEVDGKKMIRKVIEKDVALDATLYGVNFYENYVGYKRIGIDPKLPTGTDYTGTNDARFLITKYNGAKLLNDSVFANGIDRTVIQASGSGVKITVSNIESGWSDATTSLTSDEIKGFFNGWQAKTLDANGKPIAWKSIIDGTDAPTQTAAYVAANKAAGYTPYKLSYVLPTPVVSEAKTEGSISVNGLTQIEVGSGVVIMEKIIPYGNAGSDKLINRVSLSQLSKRVEKILVIYKNDQKDGKWYVINDSVLGYGKQRAGILDADFDPTAEYYVSYIMYDRNQYTTNAITATATFANNIRAALDDGLKSLEDTKRDVSVQSILMFNVLARLKAGGL